MYNIQEENAFRKDLAPVAWIVSNCRTRNGCRHYVEQLLKHIKVDIYGKCMTNMDWSEYQVMRRYKFYLSIENNYCANYVTEKIQHPYSVGVVPILDGFKDYSRFLATNHSSLRLDDFATSKQLAHRILELDQDDAPYMMYLDYKESTTSFESLLHPSLLETFDVSQGNWGPDGDGARCRIYKMAREMAEGAYQFNSSKVIGTDTACDMGKWAHIGQKAEFIIQEAERIQGTEHLREEAELHWWLAAVVMALGVFTCVILITICYKSHRARWSLQALANNLTLNGWREKTMDDGSENVRTTSF
ncbi:Alpha-(1,3)-fucosyltransferase 11 [Linnemannia hyalina]|uniref:Fucosyltransferase n=1 Tax=Linnemannia hyalina TaxID=64524 RepID=A0A9P8BWC6_9FUNG|nr:Alpha-(1,3)-fucosyltransferase 11 [Linnemannia hyalina]